MDGALSGLVWVISGFRSGFGDCVYGGVLG